MAGFGADPAFFRQMAQRRVSSRPRVGATRPGGIGAPPPPAPMGGDPAGATAAPDPGRAPMPPPAGLPPMSRPPMAQPPTMSRPPGPGPLGGPTGGFTGAGGLGGRDPGGMAFFGLPQGTEEAFGVAPKGFNNTLRRPGMGMF